MVRNPFSTFVDPDSPLLLLFFFTYFFPSMSLWLVAVQLYYHFLLRQSLRSSVSFRAKFDSLRIFKCRRLSTQILDYLPVFRLKYCTKVWWFVLFCYFKDFGEDFTLYPIWEPSIWTWLFSDGPSRLPRRYRKLGIECCREPNSG